MSGAQRVPSGRGLAVSCVSDKGVILQCLCRGQSDILRLGTSACTERGEGGKPASVTREVSRPHNNMTRMAWLHGGGHHRAAQAWAGATHA